MVKLVDLDPFGGKITTFWSVGEIERKTGGRRHTVSIIVGWEGITLGNDISSTIQNPKHEWLKGRHVTFFLLPASIGALSKCTEKLMNGYITHLFFRSTFAGLRYMWQWRSHGTIDELILNLLRLFVIFEDVFAWDTLSQI